jgi:hypothetical protein
MIDDCYTNRLITVSEGLIAYFSRDFFDPLCDQVFTVINAHQLKEFTIKDLMEREDDTINKKYKIVSNPELYIKYALNYMCDM